MMSRKALSLIKEEFISNIENEETNDCWNESDKEAEIVWWKEKFEVIEKDLKALEILKKHMWFSFHKELGFQVFCNDTIDLGNEEEFNLLKERLEND